MKPTTIRQDGDSIVVESPILALKLDTNRIVYSQARYAEESGFKRINELPRHIKKSSQKRVFLYQLHQTLQDQILANPKLTQKQSDNVKEQQDVDTKNDESDNDDMSQTDEDNS